MSLVSLLDGNLLMEQIILVIMLMCVDSLYFLVLSSLLLYIFLLFQIFCFCFCRECSFFLIIDHFSLENHQMLLELRSHPYSLFLFLKSVIEVYLFGTLNFPVYEVDYVSTMVIEGVDSSNQLEAFMKRLSNFPKLLQNSPVHVTDDMAELYLEVSFSVCWMI